MGDISEHFSRSEFACKDGCGFDTVDTETLAVVEGVRTHFNVPVHIDSGCRCLAYNEKVGGERHSQHMLGRAADIQVEGYEPSEVQEYLLKEYSGKYGIGRYDTFTHIDTRSEGPARWDMRTKK